MVNNTGTMPVLIAFRLSAQLINILGQLELNIAQPPASIQHLTVKTIYFGLYFWRQLPERIAVFILIQLSQCGLGL